MSKIKEAWGKREAELKSKISKLVNVGIEVFEDGFQRALRQLELHHPTVDSSIFDMDKEMW